MPLIGADFEFVWIDKTTLYKKADKITRDILDLP